jgi:predicted Zn finger-like uncharacterized protein
MRKRFLHICKNPLCQKEFGILYDKSGQLGVMVRCPHCKTIQKVVLPAKGNKARKKR